MFLLYYVFLSNNQSTATSPLKHDFLGKYFLNDLEYIAQASQAAFDIQENEGLQFVLRGTPCVFANCSYFSICNLLVWFLLVCLAVSHCCRFINLFFISRSKLG